MNKIAGLILAAGASTRMGKPKQVLPAGGMGLLDRILQQALKSRLDLVVLVLGFKAQEIKETLSTDLLHSKLRIVENKNYMQGISSSIISGLCVAENDYDHVMIILGDVPLVSAELINHLIGEYLKSQMPLGAIKVENRRAHPVLISRHFYPELHQLKGDIGARHLFVKHVEKLCLVEPEEDYQDLDIDSPEDYFKFKRSFEHQVEKD